MYVYVSDRNTIPKEHRQTQEQIRALRSASIDSGTTYLVYRMPQAERKHSSSLHQTQGKQVSFSRASQQDSELTNVGGTRVVLWVSSGHLLLFKSLLLGQREVSFYFWVRIRHRQIGRRGARSRHTGKTSFNVWNNWIT